MYCYNCGNKIKNQMYKCPFCETKIDSALINEVVLENTWAEIAKSCPSFSKSKHKVFTVDEKGITISGENYVFANIHSFINKLYHQTLTDIEYIYDHWTFDELVKRGEEFVYNKLSDVGNAILGFKYKNSGEITDDDKFGFMMLMQHVEFAWAPIYATAEEFDDLQDVLAERRNSMNIERTGQWVGGGFGLSGAIKGKIKADILNAGASAINSGRNLVRKTIQSGIDRSNINILKKEVKNSPELKNAVFSEINQYFIDWTKTLSAIFIGDSNKFEKVGMDTADMVKKQIMPSYSEAFDILNTNPYNILAYVSIYHEKPQTGVALAEIVRFCGIETNVLPRFQTVDKIRFNDGKIKLHSVGIDTDETDLRKIKEILVELEKNNPAYTLDIPALKNAQTVEEQRYHRKVDELLAISHIEKAKQTVNEAFNNHSWGEAVNILLQKNDDAINNLLFYKLTYLLNQKGSKTIISALKGTLPPLVADILIIHWHRENPSKYENMLQTVIKMGHVFPIAYYGEWCYLKAGSLKDEGIKKLIYAAKKNCALALMYVGRFYKNGSDGKYRDSEVALSYLNTAVALGEYNAKKDLQN